MKKILSVVMSLILLAGLLAGCTGTGGKQGDKLSVVVTIFPEYDWVMNILGDRQADTDVTLLIDNKVDMHNYQPTAEDIVRLSTCDLFIYVGGESDGWVDDALKQSLNPDMVTLNLMSVLGDALHEEELAEGMEGEEEEEEEDEEGPEYDEHVWLSLRNASALCGSIAEALGRADPDNADVYSRNAADYKAKIADLESKYAEAVSEATVKTLLFGDRFPFRYLVEDYGLSYYAAFKGCSAETEASFKTITFLAGKADELSLKCIMIIDGSDGKIADSIRQNTASKDQQILSMDSMQALNRLDWQSGVSYLSIMEKNLETLKQALK